MTAAPLSAHIRSMDTLTAAADSTAGNDVNARLTSAQDPDTDSQALWQLIDDHNDLVANTARQRLGLAQRPTFNAAPPVHIPRIDLNGRILP